MNAIARYSERRHDGKREFTLFADRVEIRGKEYLGAEYETTVPLKTLAPEIDRMRVRCKTFSAGLWLLFVPATIAFMLVEGFGQPAFTGVTGMLWTFALCGAVVLLATLKKETYAIFKSRSGRAALSIAREGKERECFDDFVAAVQRQIIAVRNSEPAVPPSGGSVTPPAGSGAAEGAPPSVS